MRSAHDCKVAGVCGGFAEYLDAEPTLVRLIWVLLTRVFGIVLGLVVYAVAWIIMPSAPLHLAAPEKPVAQNARTA